MRVKLGPLAAALLLSFAMSAGCSPDAVAVDGETETEDEVGESSSGELTDTDTDTDSETEAPPDLPDPTPDHPLTAVAVGDTHSCVLLEDGSVACWGENEEGRLGQGHTQWLGDDELPCGRVDLGGTAVAIDASARHSCALREDGAVYCWGFGYTGLLGYANGDNLGNDEAVSSVEPVDLGEAAEAVFVGPRTSCARTVGQELVCWGQWHGYPGLGLLGDDEHPSSAGVVEVGGVVLDMSFTDQTACALLDGGAVRCWGFGGVDLGSSSLGETIGDDEVPASVPPVELSGPALAIEGGMRHHCALLEGGAIQCWGKNDSGQLGYGHTEDIGDDESPAEAGTVDIGEPAVAIAAGGRHSCAVGRSGAVFCWGWDIYGQLGYPDGPGYIGSGFEPVEVGPIALPGAADWVGAGFGHSCARLEGGLYCWGAGWSGQLGSGESENLVDPSKATPVTIECPECCAVEPPPADRLDGERDVELSIASGGELPPQVVEGAVLRVLGTQWPEIVCEACAPNFVVRDAVDQSLLFAQVTDRVQLHPSGAVLASLGPDASEWFAPLELTGVDPGLCEPLEDPCMGDGERLLVEASFPGSPTASILDGSVGQVGGGFRLGVQTAKDWSEGPCEEVYAYELTLARQPCAPDCGPVSVVEGCEAFEPIGMGAAIAFDRELPEIAYDLECTVLAIHEGEGAFEWVLDLDCVGD